MDTHGSSGQCAWFLNHLAQALCDFYESFGLAEWKGLYHYEVVY